MRSAGFLYVCRVAYRQDQHYATPTHREGSGGETESQGSCSRSAPEAIRLQWKAASFQSMIQSLSAAEQQDRLLESDARLPVYAAAAIQPGLCSGSIAGLAAAN